MAEIQPATLASRVDLLWRLFERIPTTALYY
jgi:hypothetical protein